MELSDLTEKKRFERNKKIPGIFGDDVICDVFDAGYGTYDEKRPAVIFVHGGGFVGGDKDQFLGAASWLALNMDILCITMQYRLAPEHTCPAPMVDCFSVFQWIKKNQEDLRIDLRLVFVAGGSPGANIGAMAMFADQSILEQISISAESLFQPDHGIFLNGIYDLTDFYEENPAERARLLQYLGKKTYDRGSGERYSPIYQNPIGKYILMLHGSDDKVVPLSQCKAMQEKLERNGNRVWLEIFEGKEHAWFNQQEEAYEVLECIKKFIIIRKNEVLRNGD